MSFVHLHTHSHYSLLDGLGTIDKLVAKTKESGMPALALTDHGVMYGAVEFYQKMKKAGLKPIIGVEAYIAPNKHTDKRPKLDEKPYHLVLLAKNNIGYANLLKLTSIAHIEGYYYKPRIDWELLEQYKEGLIVLTACFGGEVPRNIRHGHKDKAIEAIKKFKNLFNDDFYLELQDHPSLEGSAELNNTLIELSKQFDIPLVATNDIHYVNADDDEAQDVLLCLQTKRRLSDTDRMSYMGEDFSFRSADQMKESFKHIPEAIENTLKIAEKCNIELDFDTIHLPHYELPDNKDADEYLRELSIEGIKKRYIAEEMPEELQERMDYELDIIKKTGYASYFLIVQDFINWAKSNGIMVGPGRGSAAGSLVSYLVGITNIDPLHYELLFERFLNPERISMPDIDIDFSDARRDEVIEYAANKYGKQNVSQIITFGTLGARVAIRDVGRVMGYSYGYCDRIAKLIPMFTDLNGALKDIPEIKEMYNNDPEATKLINMAKKVEGVCRHSSTHACGVLITEKALTEYVPIQYASSSDKSIVSQYSLHPVEDLGLLKMDFLGLKNLTLIETSVEIISKTVGDIIDIDKIPLDNKKTFSIFKKGDTTGVFQFESSGMRRYLKQLKPNELEDIIVMVSLYRPGPMELIPDYINLKHGKKKAIYLHPKLEEILGKTHGIIIYQEQIMQIARKLAGFTYGQADVLRKAVGKKIKKLMDEQEQKLISGMVNNGIDQSVAKQIWQFILPFARYGFNRSHAACYAMISYQTAYLKANYPAQFMAALLTSDLHNTDKISMEVAECEKMGIKVLPPDINESYRIFTVVMDEDFKTNPRIRFGLEAIKNVGNNIASVIISARKEGGVFTSLEDFLLRVKDKDLNKKSLESLIRAGALDRFEERGTLLNNIEKILEFVKRNNTETNQSDLFAGTSIDSKPTLILEEGLPIDKQTQLAWEKDLLGIYISDHPINDYKQYIGHDFSDAHEIAQGKNRQVVKIAGIISGIKKIITGAGKPMLFATIEDQTGSCEIIVFTNTLDETRTLWEDSTPLFIEGKISNKDGQNKIICETARLLNAMQPAQTKQKIKQINIILPAQLKKTIVDRLKDLLKASKGTCPVIIKTEDNKILSDNITVKASPDFISKLQRLIPASNLHLDKD
ncbi:DNA polymerase III subunit alpha [Patescibacteria group bacterium]|nr:DNA polymerase III subunit alpha [Patescibacteria group bacterium]